MHVSRGGAEIALGTPKQRAVLGLLVVRCNERVGRDAIIDAVWGDRPPATVVNVVQQYIRSLRGRLAPGGGHGAGWGGIATVPKGYMLHAETDQVDLLRFRHLVTAGQQAGVAGDAEGLLAGFTEALALWRGTPFAGLEPRFREHGDVLALSRQYAQTAAAAAAAALDAGRSGEVLPHLEAAAAQNPLDEPIQAQLMLSLAALGRQADALQAYDAIRHRLDDELGLDPGRALQTAHLRVLRQELPFPAGTADTGDAGMQPGPARAVRPDASAIPAQLPIAIGDFTGRDKQIAALHDHLLGEDAGQGTAGTFAVSAIVGQGGVGKTALAVHVAHQIAASYPGGQLYVNLRGGQPEQAAPAAVLAQFLLTLGVDGSAIPDDTDERAALYRSRTAGRRILLVLDNAADESQVRPLLPGSPRCAVLITSRTRLSGLEGAQLVDLDVFDPFQAVELLGKVVGVQRVSAEPEAATEIARLCGRLPLAVRVAAAKLAARPHWSLGKLSRRLANAQARLDELAFADFEVRASVALSYGGLQEEERRALRLLSLLEAADFTLWVAAATLDTTLDEAEEIVDALVDSRLLYVLGNDAMGEVRYSFHDLIRLYARERCDDEDRAPARSAALERAFSAWLQITEEADARLEFRLIHPIRGGAPRWRTDPARTGTLLARPLAWFMSEQANMVTAIRQAVDTGFIGLAWELAAGAIHFFSLKGLYPDWEDTYRRVSEACRDAGDRLGEAALLSGLVLLGVDHPPGETSTFLAWAERAHVLFCELAASERESGTRERYGVFLAYLKVVIAVTRALGCPSSKAHAWHSVTVAHLDRTAVDRAADAFRGALRLARENRDTCIEMYALRGLAVTHRQRGEFDESQKRFEQAIAVAGELGFGAAEAYLLADLGELYIMRGDTRSEETVRRALALFRELDIDYGKAVALSLRGELETSGGRWAEAVGSLREARSLFDEATDPYASALALKSLGIACERSGDRDSAMRAWRDSRTIFARISSASQVRQVDTLIAELAAEHGHAGRVP